MKLVIALTAVLAFAVSGAHAQSMKSEGARPAPEAFSKVQARLTEGEVRKVNKAAREITLKHGDLPSIGMGPMTMAFAVSDPAMLDTVKAGDRVRFSADIVKGKPTVTRLEASR